MKTTEIIMLLDASGSMSHLANDTIGGFNGFIESQKTLDGKATLTTVLFNTTTTTIHNGINLHEVKPLTKTEYSTYGGTAMLDAIGETINKVQDRHDYLGVEKPEEVLFVITTDGEENASYYFKKSQIEKMIKHQTNGHGWKFIFLGANMDAVKEAENIGISKNWSTNYDYTVQGTGALYATLNIVTAQARRTTLDTSFNLADTYATTISSIDTNK